LKNERVKRERVEPVAHLTDNLTKPQLSEAAISTQQIDVSDLCGTSFHYWPR